MLPSRLLSSLRPLRLLSLPLAAFSWDSPLPSPFLAKITSTHSFADFYQLYSQNRSECGGEVIASASKHINELISNKERIHYNDIGSFVKGIVDSDLSTLTPKASAAILSILRNLKLKDLTSPLANNLKNSLISKFAQEVVKNETDFDATLLSTFYYEAAFFNNIVQCRIISQRILRKLENGQQKALSTSQMIFLLHVLATRESLSSFEIKIRRLLLKKVVAMLPTIRLSDLVKAAVNINRMDCFDFNPEDFTCLKRITSKIEQNIEELEQRSVYELIRGDYASRYIGFFRIYEKIANNIFEEIDERGDSALAPEAVLKVLSLLSDKVNLDKFPPNAQEKLFKLLDRFAERKNTSKTKNFSFNIHEMVRLDFFDAEGKKRLLAIVHKHNINLNLSTLYEMAVNDYDLSGFSSLVLSFKTEEYRGNEFLVRMAIIASKVRTEGNAEVAEVYNQLEEKVAELVSTPEKFSALVKKWTRSINMIRMGDFHRFFSHLIERLPNPFTTPTENSNYRYNYLLYHQQAIKTRDFHNFLYAHDSSIPLEDFIRAIRHHNRQELKPNDYKRSLVHGISRRLIEILESKNRKYIETIIQFIGKYNKAVLYNCIDDSAEIVLFKMIATLAQRLDLLASTDNVAHFCYALDKFLSRSYRRYNIEQNYKAMIKQLVPHIDKINKKGTVALLLEEGLRLNLLTKESLQNVDLEKITLPFFSRARISVIKNEQAVALDGLSERVLEVVFSSQLYQKFIQQNEAAIISIIKETNHRQLAYYLTFYSLTKTFTGKHILSEILTAFIDKLHSFDRIDIISILNNSLDKGFYHYQQCRKLAEKAVEEFRKKISNYSLDSHMQLLRFLISQPGMNPREYYNQLAEYAQGNKEIRDFQYEHLMLRLASTNHLFKEQHLAPIHTLLAKNIQSSLYLFLMCESFIEPPARAEYVRSFIDSYRKLSEKKKEESPLRLSKAYYLYLKAVYPEQTEGWTVEEACLFIQRFTIKSHNKELLQQIQKVAGMHCEEVTDFGLQNHFYKLKNCIITFFPTKRVGSYYEHDFIKRLLRAVKGSDITPVCVYINNSDSNILEYINKECPGVFDPQRLQAVVREAKDALLLRREKKKEESEA